MSDRVEKSIELKASPERVWRALTDHVEFGAWFRVRLDGPFEVGKVSTGHVTYPGYEHLKWEARIETMDAPRLFAFTWHPYAIDPDKDYSAEPSTRVSFTLEPVSGGTRLTVCETGFEALPPERGPEALRMNERGWTIQMENIQAHVAA